jgi:hypothetical protein
MWFHPWCPIGVTWKMIYKLWVFHIYIEQPPSHQKKAQLRHAYFALSLFQGELNDQTFSSLSFCTHWREAEGHQQLKAAELRPFFGHCDLFWAMVIET